MSGYSGRPLSQKLGIKPGFRMKVLGAPDNYIDLVEPLPEGVDVSDQLKGEVEMCHLFTASRAELDHLVRICMSEIIQDGMIWVSWPKKSSGVPSEVTEDTVREVALPLGLVDVKVCAVDETWSGLKLVIRKENRR